MQNEGNTRKSPSEKGSRSLSRGPEDNWNFFDNLAFQKIILKKEEQYIIETNSMSNLNPYWAKLHDLKLGQRKTLAFIIKVKLCATSTIGKH